MRRNVIVLLSLAICFALGFAFHKYAADLFRNCLGVSAGVLIKSPGAVLRVHNRGWNYFDPPEHPQGQQSAPARRYIETGLLPLLIDGKRLSDFYPAAKIGGAITSVGPTVVILDRLGSLYRYDPKAGSFGTLQFPKLPNNIRVLSSSAIRATLQSG